MKSIKFWKLIFLWQCFQLQIYIYTYMYTYICVYIYIYILCVCVGGDLGHLLEKEMTNHSSILAWRIPWLEDPGGLLSMWLHRVIHDWSDLAFMHALEKEMATHSSIVAWRIPGTEEPGGLPSMGSHRVRHDWSDLAAAGHLWLSY